MRTSKNIRGFKFVFEDGKCVLKRTAVIPKPGAEHYDVSEDSIDLVNRLFEAMNEESIEYIKLKTNNPEFFI